MLRDDDFPRLARAAGILGSAPIWIDDTPGITLLEMRSKARRLKADHGHRHGRRRLPAAHAGPGELREPAAGGQPDLARRSRRSRRSCAFRSSRCRSSRARPSSAPATTSGRSSPTFASRARSSRTPTSIMFIYRQEFYDGPIDKDGNSLEGRAEIIVGKQRNGPIGIVNLFFHKKYTRFENLHGSAAARSGSSAATVERRRRSIAAPSAAPSHPKWARAAATCAASGTRSSRRSVAGEDRWRRDRRAGAGGAQRARRGRQRRRRRATARRERRRAARWKTGHRRVRLRARRRHRAGLDGARSAASRASASRRCCCRCAARLAGGRSRDALRRPARNRRCR